MISWIQQTFQQHFRIIFLVLLALVVVAFVFTIGAAPGIGQAERKAMNRPFFGANLGSQADQERVFGEASLSAMLQTGFASLQEHQLQDYALSRYAGLALAKQLNIPSPTQEELEAFIKRLPAFAGPNGEFDAQRYTNFRDQLKANPQFSEGDVSRVLLDDLRYERIQKILGGPGYVLPVDVQNQLIRAEATWTIAVASVDAKSFSPTITPSDEDLKKFFEDNSFRYEIPPQASLSAVEFPAENFVSQVSVTEEAVKDYYDANPARFPRLSEGPVSLLPTPGTDGNASSDYLSVRPRVEAALKLERARQLAAKAASDLAFALYDQKVSREAVEAFLAARNLSARELPPFSRNQPAPELGGNPEAIEAAFRLGEQRYFSDALSTPSGNLVLLWKSSIPARQPLLVEVQARVRADFVEQEKRKRFVELGRSLHSQLEAQLKTGANLETAAAAASGASLEVKTFPAFSRRQPPADIDYTVLGALEQLGTGKLSDMIVTPEKGLFVYAIEKKLPDITESNPQYVSTRDQLAQFTAGRTASDYLHEIVEKELSKSAPAMP